MSPSGGGSHQGGPFRRDPAGPRDNQATPEALYKKLDAEFHFTFDPCSTNPLGLRLFDGLGAWGERNFVNPPYSQKVEWIKKAIVEQKQGNLTVMLLPVDTSTAWFHDLIIPHADVRFLRGRLRFGNRKYQATFPSMVCVFRP